jgi:hypothetical protein
MGGQAATHGGVWSIRFTRKAAQCLEHPPFSERTMPVLEALHPPPLDVQSMPAAPVTAPVIVIDKAKLKVLIRSYPKGPAAGPSGWTAELLPLLEDDTCLDGIALLVQLIANNQLDPHSRCLLTDSLLLGIPKSESDALRPLAMGSPAPQAGGQVLPQLGQRQLHRHL